MDSIFVKFLKYLRNNSTENTSDADFTTLVNQTLNSDTFSVPRSETSTKVRTCPLPTKFCSTSLLFWEINHFGVFFNKLSSGDINICCLDFMVMKMQTRIREYVFSSK